MSTREPAAREARQRLEYEIVRRVERGESVRAVARTVRVSRKLVAAVMQRIAKRRTEGDLPSGTPSTPPKTPRASKLDAYGDKIAELLRVFPDIRAQRLHEELQAVGFDGGYTIVREHLKTLRPPAPVRVFRQVVTGPGAQGQMDWSPYTIGRGIGINAFSHVLSHSRYQAVYFTTNTKQVTLFDCLVRSFEEMGGVPTEIVTDSMPGVVDRWELEQPVLNLRAVDFAAWHGFSWHIAPRANGAYKGKVERPFRFLEESFFNGRRFESLVQAQEALSVWKERRCNGRVHGTTGLVPAEQLEVERSALRPVTTRPYDTRELAYRIVDPYGRAAFEGNFYAAPNATIGAWVYVRASADAVALYDGAARLLATYERVAANGRRTVGVVEASADRQRVALDELVAAFEPWGQTALAFAQTVRKQKRNVSPQLGQILELQREWSRDDIVRAIEHAAKHGAFEGAAVKRILEVRCQPRPIEDQLGDLTREHLRNTLADRPVRQRPLADYAPLLAGSAPAGDPSHVDEDCNDEDPNDEDPNETSRPLPGGHPDEPP